jgi:general secretion pathway protein K
MNNNSLNRQGIAIISILIVIALISVSVSLMFQRFGRDLKQTQYILNQTIALNHQYNIEAWAKIILSNDELNIDTLNEDWATEIIPIQIPDGLLYGKLTDLQSKLNLNNLIDLKTDVFSPQYRLFFYDCINSINTQLKQKAMADTIFSYVVSQPSKPKLFEHLAELKNIQTISDDDYLKIKPYLTALPTLSSININTADKYVLSCIHPQLSGSLVDKIIQQRKNQGFDSVDDFWLYTHSLLPNLTLEQVKDSLPVEFINTTSNYFLLVTRVVIDKNKLIGRTILHRKDGKITVMNRSYHQAL